MDSTELDRLVDAARAGEAAAFSALWTELGGRVHGYFRAYGCRDAEDLTSETFLAAFAGIGDVVGDGAAFRTWLFSIAHHKRVDDVRRRSRRPATVPYEPDLDRRLTGPAEETSLSRRAHATSWRCSPTCRPTSATSSPCASSPTCPSSRRRSRSVGRWVPSRPCSTVRSRRCGDGCPSRSAGPNG